MTRGERTLISGKARTARSLFLRFSLPAENPHAMMGFNATDVVAGLPRRLPRAKGVSCHENLPATPKNHLPKWAVGPVRAGAVIAGALAGAGRLRRRKCGNCMVGRWAKRQRARSRQESRQG